jgi:hypothetical protein
MNTQTQEALKMAIEWMDKWHDKEVIVMNIGQRWVDFSMPINACKEALEQPTHPITEGATMFKQVGNSPKPPSPLPPMHTCIYSRTMNQEYPRKCIQCGKVEALEQQEIGDAEIKQMLNDIEYYQKRVKELEQLLQDYVLICKKCGDDIGIAMDDM